MKCWATQRLVNRANKQPDWSDLSLSPHPLLILPLDVDPCDTWWVLDHRGTKSGLENAPAFHSQRLVPRLPLPLQHPNYAFEPKVWRIEGFKEAWPRLIKHMCSNGCMWGKEGKCLIRPPAQLLCFLGLMVWICGSQLERYFLSLCFEQGGWGPVGQSVQLS